MAHLCPFVPILLVATKMDLRDNEHMVTILAARNQQPVTSEGGLAVANEIGAVRYMECSAITQMGVREIFEEAVRVARNSVAANNEVETKKRVKYI